MINVLYVAQFHETCGYSHAAIGYLKSIHEQLKENKNINFKILSVSLDLKKLSPSFHKGKTEESVLELFEKYHFADDGEYKKFVNNDYKCIWHMTSVLPVISKKISKNNFYNKVDAKINELILGSIENYHILAWETDKLPQEYEQCIRQMGPLKVITPSEWNTNVIGSVFSAETVPHLIEPKNVKPEPVNLPQNIEDKFVVLSISEWVNRKNFEALIRSFILEFSTNEDCCLIIKTSLPQNVKKETFVEMFNNIKNTTRTNTKKLQNIFVILDYLSDSKMRYLYNKCDLFCLTSFGEGFSLPTSEAIALEKNVLCPDQGGHIDYMSSKNRYFVTGIWDTVFDAPPYDCDGRWYIPSISEIRNKLKLAYEDWKNKNPLALENISNNTEVLNSGKFSRSFIGSKIIDIVSSSVDRSENETSALKRRLKNKTLNEKVSLLENSFAGQDCYVLSCGPSLNDYDRESLKKFLKDKLVLSVKQAYNLFNQETDFHFFNCSNLPMHANVFAPPYENRKNTISVSSSNYDEYMRWSGVQESDIFFKIPIRTEINNEFLVRTGKIDDYLLKNNLTRPCGPGIMYETVLYTAIHLGVKSITCIGWDLTKDKVNESNYEHFYGTTNSLLNRGDILDWEIEETRNFSKNFYEWCSSKEIQLNLASERSSLYEGIPRVKLEI